MGLSKIIETKKATGWDKFNNSKDNSIDLKCNYCKSKENGGNKKFSLKDSLHKKYPICRHRMKEIKCSWNKSFKSLQKI